MQSARLAEIDFYFPQIAVRNLTAVVLPFVDKRGFSARSAKVNEVCLRKNPLRTRLQRERLSELFSSISVLP